MSSAERCYCYSGDRKALGFCQEIDEEARRLFTSGGSGFHELTPPCAFKRHAFFRPMVEALAFPISLPKTQATQRLPPPEVCSGWMSWGAVRSSH